MFPELPVAMGLDIMSGLSERSRIHVGQKKSRMNSHVRKMDFVGHKIPVSDGWILAKVFDNWAREVTARQVSCVGRRKSRSSAGVNFGLARNVMEVRLIVLRKRIN